MFITIVHYVVACLRVYDAQAQAQATRVSAEVCAESGASETEIDVWKYTGTGRWPTCHGAGVPSIASFHQNWPQKQLHLGVVM